METLVHRGHPGSSSTTKEAKNASTTGRGLFHQIILTVSRNHLEEGRLLTTEATTSLQAINRLRATSQQETWRINGTKPLSSSLSLRQEEATAGKLSMSHRTTTSTKEGILRAISKSAQWVQTRQLRTIHTIKGKGSSYLQCFQRIYQTVKL